MVAPKLRFKEFDGDWDLKNLGDCFSLFSGYAFPSSASVDNGTKWLKIADVGIQEMTPNNLSFLPNNFTTKFPQFIVYKNDYVIALTRPILNKKLKISKVGEFYDGALLNQRVAKIVTENNNLDFIYSLLQKSKTVEELENSIAGTDPPNLSLNEVKGIILGIPKIQEQTKIASFLSNVDEKVSQLTQKHALLSQYKQGMMQKLFSQQMRFKADDGSEFGEWEELALKQLGKSYNGLTGKTKVDFGQGDAFVTYKQIFENRKINLNKVDRVKISPEESQNNVVKGDLFFTTSSETPDEVAYCSAILDDFDYPLYLNSFCFGFRPNNQQQFSSNYASLFFRSDEFRSKILHLAQGSTRYNISKTAFMDVEIKLPCLAEQAKIANFLSAIDQKIEVVAQQIEQAKTWKKGLLQQMFV